MNVTSPQIPCNACGTNPAVFLQRHTGKALCLECLRKDLVNRVAAEIIRNNMFNEDDRLLLALSGGKDSYVLLDTIARIHDPRLIGVITIIEGIPRYNRVSNISWIMERTRKLGIELHVVSFKSYVGYTLEELVLRARELRINVSPCTFCGVIRRRIMNHYALMYGYDCVLTAHNLDDEVQTVLADLMRGDLARFIQLHPLSKPLSKYFVKRVKPLRRIYEYEITAYAYATGFKFQEVDCPYIIHAPTLRAKLRDYLHEVEGRRPGTLLKVLDWYDRTVRALLENRALTYPTKELPQCPLCGSPMAFGRRYCMLCELLLKLKLPVKYPALGKPLSNPKHQ